MFFKYLKMHNIYSSVLIAIPIYCWYKYYRITKHLEKTFKEDELFWKKHNCVIMYSKEKGMSGWPSHEQRLKLNLENFSTFSEPIIYFIDTATTHINIAIMLITMKSIIQALINAMKRGVKIKLIFDHSYMRNEESIKLLQNHGAEILYFVINNRSDGILHYKYALKDVSDDGNGFVICGSMNWTSTAPISNYEDLVFTTNKSVVKAFYDNFVESWDCLKKAAETDIIVKATLYDNL